MFKSPLKWLLGGYLFAAGCVTTFSSATPYTTEFPNGEWSGDYFGDRQPKVLRVSNPLTSPATISVDCLAPDGTYDHWYTNVDARSEVNVFMQTLNRDRFVDVCHVTGWNELR